MRNDIATTQERERPNPPEHLRTRKHKVVINLKSNQGFWSAYFDRASSAPSSIVFQELDFASDELEKPWRSVKLFLGTAQLSRAYGVFGANQSYSRESPVLLVEAAASFGYSGIDTAPVYGHAETHIGRAKSPLPVYTKLDPAQGVDDSILQSRSLLRRNFLDGVYLHEEYVASRKQKEMLQRLRDRKADDVGEVGVSIYSFDEFDLANENPDIDVLQLPYNIFDQRFSEDYVSRNLDPKKRVFARSVFLQGVLLRKASELPSAVSHLMKFKVALEEATRESGLDELDIALGFAMANQALAGIIVGTSSLKELREIAFKKISVVERDLSSVVNFDDVPTWDDVDPRSWSS